MNEIHLLFFQILIKSAPGLTLKRRGKGKCMNYTYTIKLLPDDATSIETSRQQIIKDAGELVSKIMLGRLTHTAYFSTNAQDGQQTAQEKELNKLKSKLKNAERRMTLAQDILDARFWGTLTTLDGNLFRPELPLMFNPLQKREEHELQNKERRTWTAEQFNPLELEQILNVAINQAFLVPHTPRWPGQERPHSTLYEHLVQLEDSLFKHAVTP